MVEINIYWRKKFLCSTNAPNIEKLRYTFNYKEYLNRVNLRFELKLTGILFDDISFQYRAVEEARVRALEIVKDRTCHAKRVHNFMRYLKNFRVVLTEYRKPHQSEVYQLNDDGFISTHIGKGDYKYSLCFKVEPKY